jgi:HSP20 family protein
VTVLFGFSIKIGLGGIEVEAPPAPAPARRRGKLEKCRYPDYEGEIVVQEIREPHVDILVEADRLLILAEMPGIGAKHVHLEVQDDLLKVFAAYGEKKYRKEVLLPGRYSREKMKVSLNNGILMIECLP